MFLKEIFPYSSKKKLYQVELDRQGRHYLRLLQWGSRASGKVLADLGGGELISVLSRPLCLLIEVRFLPSHRDWEIGTQYWWLHLKGMAPMSLKKTARGHKTGKDQEKIYNSKEQRKNLSLQCLYSKQSLKTEVVSSLVRSKGILKSWWTSLPIYKMTVISSILIYKQEYGQWGEK